MTVTPLATTELGATGLEITRVGLGAWAIGGPWAFGWGPQDDEESVRTIHHAVARGINWVDTAPAYGLGHGEEVVGRAVRELPEADRPLIFTKCGMTWEEGGDPMDGVQRDASQITKEVEDSLRRLGLDVIDLYQLHQAPVDGTTLEEAWTTIIGLRDAGKIRFAGISNHQAEHLEVCEAIGHVDTLQPPLSLVNRHVLDATLPWCAAHDTGVIVYSPMQAGILTGRWDQARRDALAPDDWRRRSGEYKSPNFERSLDLVERITPIADELGCSMAELAIAWTLAQVGVSGAIVGARTPEQVDGWLRAGDVELAPEQLDRIGEAIAESGAGAGPLVAT
jgi:aryl-alcohol dehydrogenase-like predicted oxidoreductase